ncbi:Uncharacterised protein [Mycobacteroides abscessus subsp. abscessus]|nr:Uncharacterised protein [Mycobacteroides abscessus subsp. abscessus]
MLLNRQADTEHDCQQAQKLALTELLQHRLDPAPHAFGAAHPGHISDEPLGIREDPDIGAQRAEDRDAAHHIQRDIPNSGCDGLDGSHSGHPK